jgi:hypothetical protein
MKIDGIPGLLLLAALTLFGATVGVSIALVWSWVSMSPELANFLGGVLGAGLGAALAVSGAVYVQHRERRVQLTPLENRIRNAVSSLQMKLMYLKIEIDRIQSGIRAGYPPDFFAEMFRTEWKPKMRELLMEYEGQVSTFPDFFALAPATYREIHLALNTGAMTPLNMVRIITAPDRERPPHADDLKDALSGIAIAEHWLREIIGLLSPSSH